MFQRLNASNLKNATILNHLLDVGIYRNAIDTGTSLDRVFGGGLQRHTIRSDISRGFVP